MLLKAEMPEQMEAAFIISSIFWNCDEIVNELNIIFLFCLVS